MKIIVVLILLIFSGCGAQEDIPPGELSGYIQIKGSDTMVNLMQALAEDFMGRHPYVFIAVTGGGSGVGIASLINGTCDIAVSSRQMRLRERELALRNEIDLQEFVIGYDGIAVVVHPDNVVERLTLSELRGIFSGEVTSWKDFGGPDKEIVILSREVNSGTYIYFREHVLRGEGEEKAEFSSRALLLSSSQALAEEVAHNPGAVGYFGKGYLNPRLKTVAVARDEDAAYHYPTEENVLSDEYPISRPLFLYTDGGAPPCGALEEFLDYIYSPQAAGQFSATGFVQTELF